MLKDVTGVYEPSFYFYGGVSAAGSILIILDGLHTDCFSAKTHQSGGVDTVAPELQIQINSEGHETTRA